MPSVRRGVGVRLVLDTNVVVSALIWDGLPERLLDLARERRGRAVLERCPSRRAGRECLSADKFIAALASRDVTPRS